MVRVVHISGAPASGKSTLGLTISERHGHHGVSVVDTDEFVHGLIGEHTPEEWGEDWHGILDCAFDGLILSHRGDSMLILVGVLHGFGPDPVEYHELRGLDASYYLSVSGVVLLRQFYARVARMDDDYWEEVASGLLEVPSSARVMKDEEDMREWHLARGYSVATADDIVGMIKASV